MRVADAAQLDDTDASLVVRLIINIGTICRPRGLRPLCGGQQNDCAAGVFCLCVALRLHDGSKPMLSSFSFDPTSSESMVFDRNDLRVLRLAYDEAVDMLHRCRALDALQRCRLAKLVIKSGWARNCRGLSLSGAETLIARDAVAAMNKQVPLALCA